MESSSLEMLPDPQDSSGAWGNKKKNQITLKVVFSSLGNHVLWTKAAVSISNPRHSLEPLEDLFKNTDTEILM